RAQRRPGRAAVNQALSTRKALKCSSLSNWGMGGSICGGSGVRVPHSTTASISQPTASQARRTAETAVPASAMGLAVTGVADHISACGRGELETIVAHRHVALHVVEHE